MADESQRSWSVHADRLGRVLAAIVAATLLASLLAAQTAYRIGPPPD